MKIAAGIVVYNPENKKRFSECLGGILKQVDRVYIFDNSTEPIDTKMSECVSYMTEHENRGVAYALNRIVEAAETDGYQWVVTLDQDSIIPHDLIGEYAGVIESHQNLGIVCPQVIDSRRAYMEVKRAPKTEFVDFCITSASCTSIAAWRNVGGFDEWLFIDLVDNDFCKRLKSRGYRILKLNNLVINQEFGNIVPKSEKEQRFWIGLSKAFRNQNVAKLSYKKEVNYSRVYYTCRNVVYLNRKLKDCGGIGYKDNYGCNTFAGFIMCFVMPSILRAKSKRKAVKAAVDGFHDGSNSTCNTQ